MGRLGQQFADHRLLIGLRTSTSLAWRSSAATGSAWTTITTKCGSAGLWSGSLTNASSRTWCATPSFGLPFYSRRRGKLAVHADSVAETGEGHTRAAEAVDTGAFEEDAALRPLSDPARERALRAGEVANPFVMKWPLSIPRPCRD